MDHEDESKVCFQRGVLAFRRGLHDEAAAWMERSLEENQKNDEAAFCLGLVRAALGQDEAAAAAFKKTVALCPSRFDAWSRLATLLEKQGEVDEALAAFSKAADGALQAGKEELWRDALLRQGALLNRLGFSSEAVAAFEAILERRPDDPFALNNLGALRFADNDFKGARAFYNRAAQGERSPELLNNLGLLSLFEGKVEEALSFLDEALREKPDFPEAAKNLGRALDEAGRHEDAAEVYRQAIALRPEDADAQCNLALSLLGLGQFEEGWRLHEARKRSRLLVSLFCDHETPEWEGEEGAGRTILLRAEQGYGDTIQFCRYAPLVAARGFHVFIVVPLPLKRLVESLAGVERVFSEGDEIPPVDCVAPLMSLPLLFKGHIPGRCPYLGIDPVRSTSFRTRMEDGVLRVGLVWAGNSAAETPDLLMRDKARSLPPEALLPLEAIRGVRFYSLQMGQDKAFPSMVDWMRECPSFSDTGALVRALDLVIGCDTAVVHLAGALGVPVWLLNRWNGCWRWGRGKEDSPWYPRLLRIFSQSRRGDWDDVIARVGAALVDKSTARQEER